MNCTATNSVSWKRRFYAGLQACLLVIILVPLAAAQQQVNSLKAAFVYNFLKYTEWPVDRWADPAAAIRLCLVNSPDVFFFAKKLERAKVQARPISVIQTSADKLQACDAVYTDDEQELKLEPHDPILTITSAGTASVIHLIRAPDDTLQFIVRIAEARNRRLLLSSRLLRVAQRIDEGE